jgi:hypothetical protein
MKRNWDTIREILLKTEELTPGCTLRLSDFDEVRAHEIAYHVKLLDESGLIKVSILEFAGDVGIHFDLDRLTWSGHEFLDVIRNDSMWNKTKEMITNKGGAMTFELVKSFAISLAKTALGI